MTVTRVGSTSQYADGWDAIFGSGRKPAPRKRAAKKAVRRKAKGGTVGTSARGRKTAKDAKPAGKKRGSGRRR